MEQVRKKNLMQVDKISEGVQSPASATGFGGEETPQASHGKKKELP